MQMRIGEKVFDLEVADTEPTRRRGLMWRRSLPEDRGMLFVFPEEDQRSFWMKNTYIPLDIIYVNTEGRVVSIHAMRPHDETSTLSAGPARYAIELNQGMAAAAGIRRGDLLEIPPGAREARD